MKLQNYPSIYIHTYTSLKRALFNGVNVICDPDMFFFRNRCSSLLRLGLFCLLLIREKISVVQEGGGQVEKTNLFRVFFLKLRTKANLGWVELSWVNSGPSSPFSQ